MKAEPKATVARGYGAAHKTERARWQTRLEQAATQCACIGHCHRHDGRCTTVITATSAWDLGHTDDRTSWTGPECIPCNRGAGARNSNTFSRVTRRDW